MADLSAMLYNAQMPWHLLSWWLRRLKCHACRAVQTWRREAEWPLLVVGVVLLLSFVIHFLGYQLAKHRATWPFPLSVIVESITENEAGVIFQKPEWEGRIGWRKPMIFGISNAMVACSLKEAIRSQKLFSRRLLSHVAAWSTAVEVAIITLQAWRGEASHFNATTTVNALLYAAKLVGVSLLGMSCVAATAGVLFFPSRPQMDGTLKNRCILSACKVAALQHGTLLLCLAVAIGVGQLLYGHYGLARSSMDEDELCLWATAGASKSPCYEIYGRAVVKLAHFLPLHATEVLLFLAWAVEQVWPEPVAKSGTHQDISQKPHNTSETRQEAEHSNAGLLLMRIAAAGHWGLGLLGVVQVLRGASLHRTMEITRGPGSVLFLSVTSIMLAFIGVFIAPLFHHLHEFPWQQMSSRPATSCQKQGSADGECGQCNNGLLHLQTLKPMQDPKQQADQGHNMRQRC
eukprot:TRINITY_DN98794_c0_g1_i1.p1 TRINITY_DN98794_c0_g1~~TRINITY_DN98794_c0_g1_i1.p1  ORF type:complete len:474 (+),score=46.25 TRINITY_DN98794_c0_g1_i1:45-1424(+)